MVGLPIRLQQIVMTPAVFRNIELQLLYRAAHRRSRYAELGWILAYILAGMIALAGNAG